jgi:hypothetical protein
MTEPVERPHVGQYEVPPETTRGDHPIAPVETQMAVQQLREAGFSEDQQAALTSAILRVLALWTQQATRSDVQTELHAGEQRLGQQLDALREELRGAFAQHADLIHTTRVEPARRRDAPMWLITALLVLTCAGVLLLVVHSFLGR